MPTNGVTGDPRRPGHHERVTHSTIMRLMTQDVAPREGDRGQLSFQRRLLEAIVESTVDAEKMLAEVTRLVVPRMADWAAVDVVDEHYTFRRLGVAHVRPGGDDLLRELHANYPLRPNEGKLRGRVLATLEPIALYDVDD